MPRKQWYRERELAALAKQFRLASGRTKAEAGRELGVTRPTMQLAEENPEQSLHKLRIRVIEKYSGFRVVGPLYRLERK